MPLLWSDNHCEVCKEGNGFQVDCSGEPPHFSTYQKICNPPPWWRERVCETGATTFYWREWAAIADDGTLQMKVSGYDEEGSHWTGAMDLPPDHRDYSLWMWILEQGDRFKTLLSDEELESIREEYRRTGHSP